MRHYLTAANMPGSYTKAIANRVTVSAPNNEAKPIGNYSKSKLKGASPKPTENTSNTQKPIGSYTGNKGKSTSVQPVNQSKDSAKKPFKFSDVIQYTEGVAQTKSNAVEKTATSESNKPEGRTAMLAFLRGTGAGVMAAQRVFKSLGMNGIVNFLMNRKANSYDSRSDLELATMVENRINCLGESK